MSHLQYFSYKGWGEWAHENHGLSQAVKIGDIIYTSGQGGWDRETKKISPDLKTEIDQAFQNVGANIVDAGGKGWDSVFNVRTYNVAMTDELAGIMGEMMKKYAPHRPTWTALGVPKLALSEMNVEIEVMAHVPA